MSNRFRLLAALTIVAGCGRSDVSPLVMWDMRPGMPMMQLDSIALHDQQERFTCLPSHGRFQECWLTTKGAYGRMRAIVDSANRVASVSYYPDATGMGMQMAAGLVMETEKLRRLWDVTAPVTNDSSAETGMKTSHWVTKDRKWRAQIVWAGAMYPVELTTLNAQSMRGYDKLAYAAKMDSLARESRRSLSDVAMPVSDSLLHDVEKELTRLVQAQEYHRARTHHYAGDLAQLHFIPVEHVLVAVNGASELGWWATARHDQLPGRSCVVWFGAPPAANAKVRLGGTAGVPECGEATL